MWLSLDELLTWNPQSDVAKPYPPKGGARHAEDAMIETLLLCALRRHARSSARR